MADEETGMPYGHLEELLKETRNLAKENHRILKRMERNALIGFFARIILWLLVLGVPLFFLSAYIGPLMSMFSGSTASSTSQGVFGLPSADELKDIVNTYRAGH